MGNLYISTYLASYRLDLCARLAREHGFSIYHYLGTTPDAMADRESYPFENQTLPVRFLFGKPYAPGLRRLLARERPGMVFVQEFSLITLQLLRWRKKYGYRLISFCDDSLDMIRGNDFSRTHRLARRIVPRMLDNLVLNSPVTAAWYQEHYGKGLELPILSDERLFRERLAAAVPEAVRLREACVPDGRKTILFIGRLIPLKNIPFLMRGCLPFRDRARLVLVGSGEQEGYLKALDRELGLGALFLGPRYGKDLLACYQMADTVVLPSRQEAYGAVVGEALMAGCPVLVSEKAGSCALIREGVNGYQFHPEKPESLEKALQAVLSTDWESLTEVRESLCPESFESSFRHMMEEIG